MSELNIGQKVNIKPTGTWSAGTDFYEGTIIAKKGNLYIVQAESGKVAWYKKDELTQTDQQNDEYRT